MKTAILILQMILSLSITAAILLQVKGTGFGKVWGGAGSSFTRRGLEKIIFRGTFAMIAVFVVLSVLQIII